MDYRNKEKEIDALSSRREMISQLDCYKFIKGQWAKTFIHLPSEINLTIYVNERELVTILCTPNKLNCLVVGFLYSEGLILNHTDIASMSISDDGSVADVELKDRAFKFPERRTLPTGCGGSAIFRDKGKKITSDLVVEPKEIFSLVRNLKRKMELYKITGGIHTSALANRKDLLVIAEDIGRHNTLDKIQGESILRGISTKDCILLITGRISSELVSKAASMQVPIIVSLKTPTNRAVLLARELNMTLVGHVRGRNLCAYSHSWRLGNSSNGGIIAEPGKR